MQFTDFPQGHMAALEMDWTRGPRYQAVLMADLHTVSDTQKERLPLDPKFQNDLRSSATGFTSGEFAVPASGPTHTVVHLTWPVGLSERSRRPTPLLARAFSDSRRRRPRACVRARGLRKALSAHVEGRPAGSHGRRPQNTPRYLCAVSRHDGSRKD